MAEVITTQAVSGIVKGIPSGNIYFLVGFVYLYDTATKKLETRIKAYDTKGKFLDLRQDEVEVIH